MHYLSFDTNIWIYLLDDCWKEENPLDYLEIWLREGVIEILLPEIITLEWTKNKPKQRLEQEKKIRAFFQMAGEIIPTAFIQNQNNPEKISKLVDKQINRIEYLINNSKKILPTPKLHSQVFDWGLLKKAPMHEKSSVADTVIVLSLIDFAKSQPNNEYTFISKNIKDFCDEKKKLHPDLKNEFEIAKIKFHKELNPFINSLKRIHPLKEHFKKSKGESLKSKIRERVFNPDVIENLKNIDIEDGYIDNEKYLEEILNKKKPTRFEILIVFGLIEAADYRRYFYRNVKSPYWFKLLKAINVFNYLNIPLPIKVEEGFQIPLWEPLIYLDKLADSFLLGQNVELIDDFIEIIRDVSIRQVNNSRTWVFFLRIIGKIPNKKIPLDLLNYIPIWFTNDFNGSILTNLLCDGILPKFLINNPEDGDVEKAELILSIIFRIGRNELIKVSNQNNNKENAPKLDTYYLSHSFFRDDIIGGITNLKTNDIVLNLGREIKYLLMHTPHGIECSFKVGVNNYSVLMNINFGLLELQINDITANTLIGLETIQEFELFVKKNQIQDEIKTLIQKYIPDYYPSSDYHDPLVRINQIILDDFGSYYKIQSFYNSDHRFKSSRILDIYVLMFRTVLNRISKQDPKRSLELLNTFCVDYKYNCSFFYKVTFFLIGQNWDVLNSLFWEMIRDKDSNNYFSNYYYQDDLYHLLKAIPSNIKENEVRLLTEIFDLGNQTENKEISYSNDYWRLRWYAALKHIKVFKNPYEELLAKLNISSNPFENLDSGIRIQGSLSPISAEELKNKSNNEIVNFIFSFKPQRAFDEFTIDGLASIIQNLVKNEPSKFDAELFEYKNVYSIYAYHIFCGFQEALNDNKLINWANLLEFAKEYISNPILLTGQLNLPEDGWGADYDWVAGIVANLLSQASTNNIISIDLLPTFKEIIVILCNNLKAVLIKNEQKKDYIMYSLNSTGGKVLKAMLDYSLFRARNLFKHNDVKKWEPEIKEVFENAIEQKIIDAFIIQGKYFSQFKYLDNNWIVNRISKNINLEDELWQAFTAGLAYINPINDLYYYDLFYPYFDKALDCNIHFNRTHDYGIVKHLGCFYLWGFETLEMNDGLLIKFLRQKNLEPIKQLIYFFSQTDPHFDNLDEVGQIEFERKIIKLWEFLYNEYYNVKSKEQKELFNTLSIMVKFFNTLNRVNTELFIKTIINCNAQYYFNIIGTLKKLKSKGDPRETALFLGKILLKISFNEYMSEEDITTINELVNFLYEFEQKSAADEFCNTMSSNGHQFLKDLYRSQNA